MTIPILKELHVKMDGYDVIFKEESQRKLVQHLLDLINQWKEIANTHKNAIDIMATYGIKNEKAL